MTYMGTKTTRRIGVVANYLSLAGCNLLFYKVAMDPDSSNHYLDYLGIAALVVTMITFGLIHYRSGFWKLTHRSLDQLDEREQQLTHSALRISYGWFTVISLVIILCHAVMYRSGVDFVITVPLAVSLIYLAHTLPSSILAWMEEKAPVEGIGQ